MHLYVRRLALSLTPSGRSALTPAIEHIYLISNSNSLAVSTVYEVFKSQSDSQKSQNTNVNCHVNWLEVGPAPYPPLIPLGVTGKQLWLYTILILRLYTLYIGLYITYIPPPHMESIFRTDCKKYVEKLQMKHDLELHQNVESIQTKKNTSIHVNCPLL